MANNSFLQSPFESLSDTLKGVEDVSIPAATAEKDEPAKVETPKIGKGISAPADLLPIFEASAKAFDVPVNVLMALGHQESRFNPNVIGPATQWGRAKGMMQYLDDTAKNLGINPFDPNEAIPAAAKQIRERLDKGYSMEDAVKEHFAGPDRKKWGEKTAAYGQEVMAKAGLIGSEIMGGTGSAKERSAQAATDLNKDDPGRYKPIDDDWISTHLSPALPRPLYEYGLKLVNPKADSAFIADAMKDYDTAQQAKTQAGANSVQGRFDTLNTEGGQFQQKLDQRLAGPQNGIVPQLPTSSDMKLADANSNFEKEVERQQNENGDFMRRFYDSGRQAKALAEGTLGLFGDISQRNIGIGGDLKEWGYKKYREDMAITEQRAKPSDDAVYVYQKAKEGDFGPVVDYLQGGAGYLTGQALEALVAGLGGAAIGTVAGTTVPVVGNAAGAVGGGIAGVASKTAVKKFIGSAIEKRLAAYAAEAAAKGLGEAEAKQYAKQVLGAQVLGSLTGSQAYNLTQELGTTYGGARDEKKGGELTGGELAKATAAGTAAAAVETLGDAFGFSRFLKGASTPKQGIASYIGAIAKEAGLNMTSEGAQELAQTALERYGSGQDLTNEDAARDYINSTLLGALGGGARGTLAGAVTNRGMVTGGGNAPVRTPPEQPAPTVTVTPPEPSKAAGPLTRAVENAATEPARVKVTAPQGEITGFVESHSEDGAGKFTTRIIGDDGQSYVFTEADGVQITQEKGPLTSAVEKVAEQAAPIAAPEPVEAPPAVEVPPAVDASGSNEVRTPQTANNATVVAQNEPISAKSEDQPAKGEEVAAKPEKVENVPVVEAKAPDIAPALEDMTEEELRARLKYMASQAKNSGGWNRMLIDERRKVENRINKLADLKAAKEQDLSGRTDEQLAYAAEHGKPGFKEAAQAEIEKRKGVTNGNGASVPVRDVGTAGAQSDAAEGADKQAGREVAQEPDNGGAATAQEAAPAGGSPVSSADASPNPGSALKDEYAGKWFGSADKAQAFIAKKKAGATHEVVQTGKVRFEVKPKATVKESLPVQAESAPVNGEVVEVKDNYGRTHRVRQSDLDSDSDRIPTVRKGGEIVRGEEIPRSIIKTEAAPVENARQTTEGEGNANRPEQAKTDLRGEQQQQAPEQAANVPPVRPVQGQGKAPAEEVTASGAAEAAEPGNTEKEEWWNKTLNVFGRRMVMKAAGLNRPDSVQWERLNQKTQEKLWNSRFAAEDGSKDAEINRTETSNHLESDVSPAAEAVTTPAEKVESTSELAKIFDGLSSKSPLVRNRAAAALKDNPLAEKITYVQSNILDILGELEDSGKVKINCD